MVPSWTQGDQVVLMLDIFKLLGNKRFVLVDVSTDTAILGRGWTIGSHQLLRRIKKGSWSGVSTSTSGFPLILESYLTIGIEFLLDLVKQFLAWATVTWSKV